MRDVAAVLLAAGASTRLGRPKQLLVLDGRALIARMVDVAVAAGCGPIVVVVGRDAEACTDALRGTPAIIVRNERWPLGMGTSIRAGFAALPAATRRAFMMLCDQPGVTAETLRRLDAAQRHAGRPVCVAAYAGTVGPPVLVAGRAIDALRTWPEAEGAKRLWLAEPDAVERVDCPEAEADIDTPTDCARLAIEPGV